MVEGGKVRFRMGRWGVSLCLGRENMSMWEVGGGGKVGVVRVDVDVDADEDEDEVVLVLEERRVRMDRWCLFLVRFLEVRTSLGQWKNGGRLFCRLLSKRRKKGIAMRVLVHWRRLRIRGCLMFR